VLKLLHTADLHLDAALTALGPRREERRRDFLQTLARIVDLAIGEEVDLVLVAGDLFDVPHPSSRVLGVVRGELKRLQGHGILPVLLPGTHDGPYGSPSVYQDDSLAGALVLHSPGTEPVRCTTPKGRVAHLYGGGYCGGDSALHLGRMRRIEAPGYHVGLLHGALEGSPEWDCRDQDLPFGLAQATAWDLDYLALGHYHRFQTLTAAGRCLGCYPGSPEGKRFGENGPRFVALVEVEIRSARVRAVPVQRRRLQVETLDVSRFGSTAGLAAAISNLGGEDVLLRLDLVGSRDAPLDLIALQAECEDGFFFLRLEDQTRCLDSDFARRLLREETVRGQCLRRCRQLLDERPDDREIIEMAWRELLLQFQKAGQGR